MRKIVLFGLLVICTCGYAASPAPGFDCKKADGKVEKMICADNGLMTMDREISDIYSTALGNWPDAVAATQKALQRGWIKGRNDCWKDADVRACVENSYLTRIVELQIASGQLEAPPYVSYLCDGDEALPLHATFYNDTQPKSAVISYGDDQVVAFVARSASGARYTAANVELWEHQGETTLDWYGTKLVCRAAPATGAH